MSQYYQTYYTTGEFAKLCHTTKETLFHYDQLGLLKPDLVKENGYRYYLSKQYFEYDFIKVLQEAKMSLKEIQLFMKERNSQNFVNILSEKNQELENEKKKIQRMQYRIQQAIHMTEYGMKTKHMEPFFEECKEEHLLTISLPGRQMTDKEMMTYISEHLEYCHQNHLTEELPIGSIVYKNQYLKGSYNENCYYVRIEKKRKDDNYWLKPKGLYGTILHEGFYDTIHESVCKLLDFIEKEGYQVIGDMYEYESHNHFTSQDIYKYLIQISIPVEKR